MLGLRLRQAFGTVSATEPNVSEAELREALPPALRRVLDERKRLVDERREASERKRWIANKRARSGLFPPKGTILFGSVASGLATEKSDIDECKDVKEFVTVRYALFSPHEVLNAGRALRAEIEARIGAAQESEVTALMFRHLNRGSPVALLNAYIHVVENENFVFKERVRDKKSRDWTSTAIGVNTNLIMDMLPGFLSALRRLEEKGLVERDGRGGYALTSTNIKAPDAVGLIR